MIKCNYLYTGAHTNRNFVEDKVGSCRFRRYVSIYSYQSVILCISSADADSRVPYINNRLASKSKGNKIKNKKLKIILKVQNNKSTSHGR